MEKFATENLILLEFLVDQINMDYEVQKEVSQIMGETCVSFQFLDNAPLHICEQDFSSGKQQLGGDQNVKSGKSCLFSLTPKQATDCSKTFDIFVEIFKKMAKGVLPEQVPIGTSLISIVNLFNELVESINTSGETPTAKTLKDCFRISNTRGDDVGHISVYIRMSCFGKLIVTQFQMNLEDKSVQFKAKEGHYLFKYNKGKVGSSKAPYDDCQNRMPPPNQQQYPPQMAAMSMPLPCPCAGPMPMGNMPSQSYNDDNGLERQSSYKLGKKSSKSKSKLGKSQSKLGKSQSKLKAGKGGKSTSKANVLKASQSNVLTASKSSVLGGSDGGGGVCPVRSSCPGGGMTSGMNHPPGHMCPLQPCMFQPSPSVLASQPGRGLQNMLPMQQQQNMPPCAKQQQQQPVCPASLQQQQNMPPCMQQQQQQSSCPAASQQQPVCPASLQQQQQPVCPASLQQQQQPVCPACPQQQQNMPPYAMGQMQTPYNYPQTFGGGMMNDMNTPCIECGQSAMTSAYGTMPTLIDTPCVECSQPQSPPDPRAQYQEIGASMGGNAITIRVHRDKAKVEEVTDSDTLTGSEHSCKCDNKKSKKKKPKAVPPTNVPGPCAPRGQGNMQKALGLKPGEAGMPFSFKMGGCGQAATDRNVMVNPPTCTSKDGTVYTEFSDPKKDVFVLRIGKKSEGMDKKNNLELELCTPKGLDYKPPPKKETRDTQYDDKDVCGKEKGEKGKGKKDKGGKGGKKGGKGGKKKK